MTDWTEIDPSTDDKEAHYSQWFQPSDENDKTWTFVISDPHIVKNILEAAGIVSGAEELKINLELRLRLEMITIKRDNQDHLIIGDVDYLQEV